MSVKSARGGASQGKYLVLFRFVNERRTEFQPDVVSFSLGIADEIRTRMLLELASGERFAAAMDKEIASYSSVFVVTVERVGSAPKFSASSVSPSGLLLVTPFRSDASSRKRSHLPNF